MTSRRQSMHRHPTPTEPAVDPAALDVLRALQDDGEPDLLPTLVEMFLADARPRLDALGDAVRQGDASAVEREAHALKGSCANFGAQPMMTLCGRLQAAGRTSDLANAPALRDGLEAEFERVRVALHAEVARDGREYSDRRG
jgi:HPt (histidine-containing phosphotransfer) domain-containing protein